MSLRKRRSQIDPEPGLQLNEGPGRLRYMPVSARHYFRGAMLQASFSKADARDLSTGEPTPEAPRTILDLLGALDRLPLHVQARGEFDHVGAKPPGGGFPSMPVTGVRVALLPPSVDGNTCLGVD